MRRYLVDAQGFKNNLNGFVFKEVTVVSLEDDATPAVFCFKPPHAWDELLEKYKSANKWLENNYHGILWTDGDIPYEEVDETLRSIFGDAQIYVKGLEKVGWFKRFLPDRVVNIEDLGCPSFEKLPVNPISCSNHVNYEYPVMCAYRNIMKMKKWMLENRSIVDF